MSDLSTRWPGHRADPTPAAKIATPAASQVLRAFGDEMTVLLTGADTGGRFTMCLDVTPPETGPPPHYHLHEDEWFYVLEGEVAFLLDGEWREVEAGTAVFVPKGSVHTFRNSGSEPLRMLVQTAPAGFETFFERCAAEFARPGPPDMARILAISAEHGIHFVTD